MKTKENVKLKFQNLIHCLHNLNIVMQKMFLNKLKNAFCYKLTVLLMDE